jgi:predicted extracellular nuclease
MCTLRKRPHLILALALAAIISCTEKPKGGTGKNSRNTDQTDEGKTKQKQPGHFMVMFYNVENLFDTINDPDTDDDAFTPTGEKKWGHKRYEKKINDIARVIKETGKEELPALIGMCEVENLTVLEDLSGTPELDGLPYGIVHFDSYDKRGIDVALLYRQDLVRVNNAELYPVKTKGLKNILTRDILYVDTDINGEAFHIFVNHWKSRYGGIEETEPMRVAAAEVVRAKIDQILEENKNAKIIVMGDFNDNPGDKSLSQTLNALEKSEMGGPGDLCNPVKGKDAEIYGSYNYKGDWEMFNQIIVSQNTLPKEGAKGYCIATDKSGAYKADWMLYEKEDGLKVPNRTYGGPEYYGGISDHLPVYASFVLAK